MDSTDDNGVVDSKRLIDLALQVAALGYPVYPTDNKAPVWYNNQLGKIEGRVELRREGRTYGEVKKGEGGLYVATRDPKEIALLFAHEKATEVSVPMGDLSGLVCIDVDVYNDPKVLEDWVSRQDWLKDTLTHKSTRGGLHYFFQAPPGFEFPKKLRPFIDVKRKGGSICWVDVAGTYTVVNNAPPKPLPLADLHANLYEAPNMEGGEYSYNPKSDSELLTAVKTAESIYESMLTLSWRLRMMVKADHTRLNREECYEAALGIMDKSVAASPLHNRHEAWLDARYKLRAMVDGAYDKTPELDKDMYSGLASLKPFQVEGQVIGEPAGRVVEGSEPDKDAIDESLLFTELSIDSLDKAQLEPLEWLVPSFIPKNSVASVAGASNVGKTNLLALMAVALAAGDTERIGWPAMSVPAFSVSWVANEEHIAEVKRRLKAAIRHYGFEKELTDCKLFVRGKSEGRLTLTTAVKSEVHINYGAVNVFIKHILEHGIRLLILDPYVTLTDGGNENDQTQANKLNEAFNLIIAKTGCSIFYTHHTPKERGKRADWYKGLEDAWRGAATIYTSLDGGSTLSPVCSKKDGNVYRGWIELCNLKVRQGEVLDSIFYEIVPQEMDEGEGQDIAVLRLSNRLEMNQLLQTADQSVMGAVELAQDLIEALIADNTNPCGEYKLKDMNDLAQSHSIKGWPNQKATYLTTNHKDKLIEMFKYPIPVNEYSIAIYGIGKYAMLTVVLRNDKNN